MTTTTATVAALPTGNTDLILDTAARYLARHGWIPTGLYDNHDGCTRKCMCHRTGTYPASLIGAIRYAVFGIPRWYVDTATDTDRHTYTAAVEWLNTYLIAHGHAGQHGPVFDWQTCPGRDQADAYGALRAAATAYRRHERRAVA
jgi:hypothetical protein